MLLVLLNWLFNGFLLGIIYLFADVLLNKHASHPTNWLFFGYIITTVLTLIGISKIGTYLLKLYLGCRAPVVSEQQKLGPLLIEVVDRLNQVKHTNYTKDKLNITLVNSQIPDSHAIGGDTLLFSDGLLLSATDEELKALIAHELAHLYNRDSFILSALIFSGLATRTVFGLHTVAMICFKWLSVITGKFGKKGLHLLPLVAFIPLLLFLPVIVFSWIANQLFDISLGFMCRQYIYRADRFVKEVGYKDGLISHLQNIHMITNSDNCIWGRITTASPPAMKRIRKLENL